MLLESNIYMPCKQHIVLFCEVLHLRTRSANTSTYNLSMRERWWKQAFVVLYLSVPNEWESIYGGENLPRRISWYRNESSNI